MLPTTNAHQEVRDESTADTGGDVRFIELLIILAKHKWMIVKVSIAAAAIALIVSFLLPKSYTAAATLMPPQQSASGLSAMLGQLGQLGPLAGMASGSLGLKNPGDIYIAMLGSRTVADDLINRFDLKTVYRDKLITDARKDLAKATSVSTGKEGVITISVEDHDPKRSAVLANAYIEELTRLSRTLAVSEASQRRLFFEGELQREGEALAQAEQEMKSTQEGTGLVQLDGQAKAMIESQVKLQAQIAAKEVQLRGMSTFATEKNPDRIRVEQELAGMRSALGQMESNKNDYGVPVKDLPGAGMEYLRKLRQLKYHETVYELLAKQFEAAKIDEAKNPVVIQVLDPAVEPERRTKPKRLGIVLGAAVAAFLFSIVLAFLLEAKERVMADEQLRGHWNVLRSFASFRKPRGA